MTMVFIVFENVYALIMRFHFSIPSIQIVGIQSGPGSCTRLVLLYIAESLDRPYITPCLLVHKTSYKSKQNFEFK